MFFATAAAGRAASESEVRAANEAYTAAFWDRLEVAKEEREYRAARRVARKARKAAAKAAARARKASENPA